MDTALSTDAVTLSETDRSRLQTVVHFGGQQPSQTSSLPLTS